MIVKFIICRALECRRINVTIALSPRHLGIWTQIFTPPITLVKSSLGTICVIKNLQERIILRKCWEQGEVVDRVLQEAVFLEVNKPQRLTLPLFVLLELSSLLFKLLFQFISLSSSANISSHFFFIPDRCLSHSIFISSFSF